MLILMESSPWSPVEHVGSAQSSESNGATQGRMGRTGSRTPRTKKREVAVSPEKQPHRFTPNDTRVPDGPPPMTRDEGLPPVPPFPLDLDGNDEPHVCTSYVSDLYGTCESKPKRGCGDRNDAGVPSASEAKQLWLEREVQSLKHALDRVTVPPNVQQSEFWAKGCDHRPQACPPAPTAGVTTSIAHGPCERHLLGGSGTDHLLDGTLWRRSELAWWKWP